MKEGKSALFLEASQGLYIYIYFPLHQPVSSVQTTTLWNLLGSQREGQVNNNSGLFRGELYPSTLGSSTLVWETNVRE